MIRLAIVMGLTLCCAGIAVGHETAAAAGGYAMDAAVTEPPLATDLPEFVLKAIPLMLAAMVFCRGLAEALLVLSKRFKSDGVGKVGEMVGTVAEVLARVLGYVGVGVPKTILMQRAEAIAVKEIASGGGAAAGEPVVGPGQPSGKVS